MTNKKQRAPHEESASPQTPDPISLSRRRSLVFISHDNRDADLAEAFGNLLTDVSGGILKHFRSSDKKGSAGIEFGEEWYKAIMGKLDEAADVVALLTQHSVDRPWILYEAGVAKGKLGSTVFGVALGIPLDKATTGPFAQFQNSGDDEDSLTKLVLQLIRRNPDASPREEAVRKHVVAFRDCAMTALKKRNVGVPPPVAHVDEAAVAKLFEEVKAMFRALPETVEEKLGRSARRNVLRREKFFHPMMFEEMLFHPRMMEGPGSSGLGWLVFVSMFRDEMPWFYELGMELYHALQDGKREGIINARDRIKMTFDLMMRGPMAEMFMGGESPDMHRMIRHMPDMLDHFLDRSMVIKGRPRRQQDKDTEGSKVQ